MSKVDYRVTFNGSMSEVTPLQLREIEVYLSGQITESYGGNDAVWKLSSTKTNIDTSAVNTVLGIVGVTDRKATACTQM